MSPSLSGDSPNFVGAPNKPWFPVLNSGALKLKPPEGDATLSAKLPKLNAGAGASAALTCSAMVLAVCRCAPRGAAAMEAG